MFRDQEEELRRLSDELRAEEEEPEAPEQEEEELDFSLDADTDIADMTGGVYRNASNDYGRGLRNYASGYRAYNADKTEVDPQALSDAVLREDEEEEKSLTGLVIAAFVLAAGVAGMLIYWLVWGGLL